MAENKIDNEMKQYVVFKIGKQEYGIDIQKVTTIEKIMNIARVPKTPKSIRGVINLRGEIITVIDLRIKFSMPEIAETDDTRIIIYKVDDITAGMIVDEVLEVMTLSEEDFENINNFSNDISLDYIYGVGKVEGRIITLLSLDKLIHTND